MASFEPEQKIFFEINRPKNKKRKKKQLVVIISKYF